MKVSLKNIENIILKKKSESTLASILMEYATLNRKLANADSQSWYFKQAQESTNRKLESLLDRYKEIRSLFNENSIDYFIHKINKNNSHIAHFKENGMNSISYLTCTSLSDENAFITELIRLKSKTKTLMPIDYYLQKPEELLILIN
ncbi:hypothetical protein DFR65_101463 [Oceanihabitans sediminis]|uniref:Uncharacterized protein n=1 Tax=Oceanihabitans sediminis TaxID=1812012 RepID=A0A368P5X6_9FLAO|nr:hypothetical protein [Oceanihabitans sediminis]RBP34569.1 hypothetical protein DFR65_101463 [Oceanihabitans sediminis]RCU58232.1 hypothetical protein DU428_02300 [Oceanihabitans sediminis]